MMVNYRKVLLALGFGGALAGMAHGALALTADELVADLQGQGYTRVELRVGPTQMKAEAIRGAEKLEVVYDSATGQVLKSETERVDAGDNTAPGISIRERNRDFVRVLQRGGGDDSAIGGNGTGSVDDRDDDHNGRGRGGSDDDDRDDDDRDDDDRDDDDRDDDHGGRHGSDDD